MANKYVNPAGTINGDGLASGDPVNGYQECGLSGKAGGDATGLATTTQYYFKVAVNGGASTEKSITTAADVTFTAVIALMNAQMTSGLAGVVWSLTGGDLRCTSPNGGATSAIALAAGTTGTNLFATLTGFSAFDAAVAGTSGAWNDLLLAFAGTNPAACGNVAAGDNVYVKCPTGTTTINLGATLTFNSTATVAAPINWIFDAGVVWSGQTGTIQINTNTSGTYTVAHKAYNNLLCSAAYNLIWNSAYTGSSNVIWFILATGGHRYLKAITTQTTGNRGHTFQIGLPALDDSVRLYSPYFGLGSAGAAAPSISSAGISFGNSYSQPTVEMWNPTFDMTGNRTTASVMWLPTNNYCAGTVRVYGGAVTNGVETQTLFCCIGNIPWHIQCEGFNPGTLLLFNTSGSTRSADLQQIFLSSIPGTLADYTKITNTSRVDWRAGQNYPTLTALLQDNSTGFSYKVYPQYTDVGFPTLLPLVSKYFTDTAATKTITVELLISNNYTNPKQNQWWLELEYVKDSDSTIAYQTSYEIVPVAGATNLASSTAAWSATTYGATSYTKYKIVLTTSAAIKQNTFIKAKVFSNYKAPSTSDFYFVDPELNIT
jgi:hypothetical protein